MQRREILVPLDGSTLAETALPHALAMARALSCGIALVTALPMGVVIAGPYAGAVDRVAEDTTQLQAYLDKTIERLGAAAPEVAARGLVEQGEPAAVVAELAHSRSSVAMVVMATHGRSGLSRAVLGSVAEQVLHGTERPLLLAHQPAHEPLSLVPARYGRVLVPLDGTAFSEAALDEATAVALATQAEVLLASAVGVGDEHDASGGRTEREAYLERHARRLGQDGLTVRTALVDGAPGASLTRLAARERPDLIVLATHDRRGWERFRAGSVAMELLHHATAPLLLLHGRAPILG